ncbi:hypothetical protein HHK36_014551 [Tetracentron sinense]|uniref:FHA domain-containing protein n=1 Tax=Tetracentron sinense TaxID=13715 RepID=A0A834YZ76_TETSI|nr:hypothetical protein HHK36_014551 [Tetracentron sinense]
MVWALFPADSLPGEQKYFIFSKGTYKVGRRGCDVIINTDKGVSRIHAEIVVDAMTSLDPPQNISSSYPFEVRIRDCSKYGTFISKKMGSKEKIHEYPNKETTLKDGDLVSFGTGNATYRFCFVPLVFFVLSLKPFQVDCPLQDKISSIGACTTDNWTTECTHVLVDQSTPIKEDLIDAIVAQKPVVLNNWVEVVAEKNIRTELPSCTPYVPTLILEGVPVKVADPKIRENCVAGYTFLLGSLHLYKFGDKLQSLFEVGGAKVLSIDEFCSSSQVSEDGGNNRVVLVIPAGSVDKFDRFHHLRSLSRVNDINLICVVLSGLLDPSVVISPSKATIRKVIKGFVVGETIKHSYQIGALGSKPTILALSGTVGPLSSVLVASSCSTDETIVADSDVEVDTATYKIDESETSELQNSVIIYSQDLIVRDTNVPASVHSTINSGVVNFKCFRKRETRSGNSFNDLVPFSKYPYKESDYGSEEVVESVKEEKKRKQMEAIAEDLFNTVKVRRRGVAGASLHGLLTHG